MFYFSFNLVFACFWQAWDAFFSQASAGVSPGKAYTAPPGIRGSTTSRFRRSSGLTKSEVRGQIMYTNNVIQFHIFWWIGR